VLYNPLCYSPWKSQVLCFLSHPSNSSIFRQLQTLLCDGTRPSLLFSITSELFLSPRGVVPLSVSLSVQLRLPVPALNCLAFYPFRPGAFLAQSFVSFVPRRPPSDRTKVFWLKNNSECKILSRLPSPFNAVYRHSMRGNTIRRKVWSHTANSGRLDVELLGAPRSCSIAGYTCGPRGGTISRAITEGEECRM